MGLFEGTEIILSTSHPLLLIFPNGPARVKDHRGDKLAIYRRSTVEPVEVREESIYITSDTGMMHDIRMLEVQSSEGMVGSMVWRLIYQRLFCQSEREFGEAGACFREVVKAQE